VEENHSELSLIEMSDHFPGLSDNFEIKRRTYVGRSHSAPTVSQVRTLCLLALSDCCFYYLVTYYYNPRELFTLCCLSCLSSYFYCSFNVF